MLLSKTTIPTIVLAGRGAVLLQNEIQSQESTGDMYKLIYAAIPYFKIKPQKEDGALGLVLDIDLKDLDAIRKNATMS